MKKFLNVLLIVLLVILLIAGGYVAYVFINYNRIEDNLKLQSEVAGNPSNDVVSTNTEYSILTYNIGFGAYTSDYSFFMDGGKSSWAVSKDSLIENMNQMTTLINSYNPDFMVLQEVDTDGTRTYHVNEYQMIKDSVGDSNYVFAQNFHSSFLMYPLLEPHGKNNSGLVTSSSFMVDNAIRRSLPVSSSVTKIVDLDRCYSITRYPVDNGKFLCIYDVHLSAYGSDATVREGQLGMLFGDMKSDYEAGNYIICGGDYNHNLRIDGDPNAPEWAQIFPVSELPDGFAMGFDMTDNKDISHNSCRNADAPYDPATAFTVLVDGFIVSDNITVNSYENTDYQYAYSDHDPVVMSFVLN